MSSTHTPGPWTADGSPKMDRHAIEVWVPAPGPIAPGEEWAVAQANVCGFPPSEVIANARLIAAAPALLAACRAALEVIERMTGNDLALGNNEPAETLLRDAIARAGGKS